MKRLVAAIPFLFFVACAPGPDASLREAEKALKVQDSEAALTHFREAYELSLPREYFFGKRGDVFEKVIFSANHGNLAVVSEKKGNLSFTVYRDSKKKAGFSLTALPPWISLSPSGEYAIILKDEKDEKCSLQLYSIQSRKKEKVSDALTCEQRPAVSDAGIAYYWEDGRIARYSAESGKSELYERFPDRPYKNIPAFASYYASPNGKIYLTYGSAGAYKLYNVTEKLNLLRKDVSTYRIYFDPQGNPAVIMGGAGKQKLVVLDASKANIDYELTEKVWEDVVLIEPQKYYFTEAGATKFFDGKESELPFWVKSLGAGKDKVYLHSQTGRLIVWTGSRPPAESILIYNKGISVDENR